MVLEVVFDNIISLYGEILLKKWSLLSSNLTVESRSNFCAPNQLHISPCTPIPITFYTKNSDF